MQISGSGIAERKGSHVRRTEGGPGILQPSFKSLLDL